jgi:hypothetical protein
MSIDGSRKGNPHVFEVGEIDFGTGFGSEGGKRGFKGRRNGVDGGRGRDFRRNGVSGRGDRIIRNGGEMKDTHGV